MGYDAGSPRRISVAIAGGGLQGMEITYLARKAGFETLLLDKRSDAPATGICHRFVAMDLSDHEALTEALGSVDLVLPATENRFALQSLVEWCGSNGMPLAFDPDAYTISSSKTASNALFRRHGIPTPGSWPDCSFPVLAKPDGGSGSEGVAVFPDLQALEARFGLLPPPGWVLQEYLEGPSYSIEVLGRPGNFTPLQITTLEMDQDYDCKRVLAPSLFPSDLTSEFEEIAVVLAESVGLSGIMDVEAIVHEGQLEILEIDARFPSQTPVAAFHSMGINMVERLARVFGVGYPGEGEPAPHRPPEGFVLEHIRVSHGQLSVCGEHILTGCGPLHMEKDFFGASEALTSHGPGSQEWVATLMVKGSDLNDARERRDRVVGEIQARFGLETYTDEYPQVRHPQPS